MKTLTLFAMILFCNCLLAQNDNALHFDNIDDNIIVPGASALISGSSQISISCWVYPENPVSAFPDYDGFCGFRNDIDADFYMVQIPGNKVEARFRNSAGVSFEVIDSALQLNTWQYYVLSYDGSELTLYRNGQLSGSVPASGNITNNSESFYIGNLIFSFNDYFLLGKIDEVGVWNRALSSNEIMCTYQSYIDPLSSGLLLYYDFNQGLAGGINISEDTLLPHSGINYGALNNFSLFGATSNWVTGIENFTPTSDFICDGQSYTFGTQVLNAPGIFSQTLLSSTGCDSIIQLTLHPAVIISVSNAGNTFTADQSGGSYQWIDCNNGNAALAGEISQSFSPVLDGDYAVVVTFNSCTDTSSCFNFVNTSVTGNNWKNYSALYPNPATNKLTIVLMGNKSEIEVADYNGKIIYFSEAEKGEFIFDISSLPVGIYSVRIRSESNYSIAPFIKN